MKLQFSYLDGGQKKYFYINAIDSGIQFNYSEFRYKSAFCAYGYMDIMSPTYGKYYGQQSDSWIEEYQAGTLASVFDFSGENAMKLSALDNFYDGTGGAYGNGKTLHFGTVGTCKLTWHVTTEYTPQPVSYSVNGGLFHISPTGAAPFYGTHYPDGSASGHSVEYTTENAPSMSFWIAHMYDDYNTDREEYHKTFDVLVVAMQGTSHGGTTNRPMFTIIDLRLFDQAAPQPITDKDTTTPYGRAGTYNFESDKMTDVSPTGFTIANRWAHGLTLYHLNDLQASAVFAELWGNETLWQMFLNSTVKQIQGILCLHKLPIPISSGSQTRALSIFGKRVARGELLEQLPLVNEQLIKYPANSKWVTVQEIYGDYFDFAGQSKLSVYLPFIGCIPLDVNQIMGGAVMTVYYFDVLTGNCIARVYGRNGMGNGSEVLLYQGSGNAALHIPFVGNDQGGMKLLGALAGVATAGIATLATGGAASAPALAAVTGTAGYALAPHNASVNNIPTECSPLSYPYVCYIQEYPERLLTDLQGIQTGFAAASGREGTTVSDYSGYVEGYLHADIDGLTDAEKAEIERMFAEGVIL